MIQLPFLFFHVLFSSVIYTPSLHDALPILLAVLAQHLARQRHDRLRMLAAQHLAHAQLVHRVGVRVEEADAVRSEEHTSELQSPCNLVCRLLLEKKNKETVTLICYLVGMSC